MNNGNQPKRKNDRRKQKWTHEIIKKLHLQSVQPCSFCTDRSRLRGTPRMCQYIVIMTEINMWVFSFLLFLFLNVGWGGVKENSLFWRLRTQKNGVRIDIKIKRIVGTCYCYIIQCRFTSKTLSTQVWFMEKKKEKEWELNSTNRGKRWGGHNCWDGCVGGLARG